MAISTQTRITRARIQLCMRKPYLSTALMRFPLVQADGIIETICTDGYHIFWSESFIDSLTDAELRGVLAHELMHVITQSADRRQERDKHLWNLATDYAINQVLVSCGFRLPGGGPPLPALPGLERRTDLRAPRAQGKRQSAASAFGRLPRPEQAAEGFPGPEQAAGGFR